MGNSKTSDRFNRLVPLEYRERIDENCVVHTPEENREFSPVPSRFYGRH